MTSRHYQHLTRDERCQIFALKASGNSITSIAKTIARHPSTISRELKRNNSDNGYVIDIADDFAQKRRMHRSGIYTKLTPDLQNFIRKKITDDHWSPEQISGWLRVNQPENYVSHEAIYLWIWAEQKRGGTLHKSLRHKGKIYQKREAKKAGRGCIPGRTDISERPEIVQEKTRIGDFEIDLIEGERGTGFLVSGVDRASKLCFLTKIAKKTAYDVSEAIINSLFLHRNHIKTLTFDNGKEFAYHDRLRKVLEAQTYFCRPYHSWERGLNEHTNGLVREFFPKGMDFSGLTTESVATVEDLLNHRPRKVLGYDTPAAVFARLAAAETTIALHS